MKQLADTWSRLSVQKRILAIAASVGMFAAVFLLSRLAAQPNLTLLYSGLESSAAGEVVQALEARNVTYEIRGSAIFVDSAQRDQLRLTLASEGLPANSTAGYELLDSLSGFGTTSQMFDAAYWRAKEGELARTILANPAISAVRVHIANARTSPFRREANATASVFVTTLNNGMPPNHAKALKFLVSSAVPGLTPENVAIIDSTGGLIMASEDDARPNAGDEKSTRLKERVTRLIEASVGPGNAVVEVSVETVTESEKIRERVIDPESRVVISTDTEERSNTAQEAAGGDVTVASNVPSDNGAGVGESNSQKSETRERINYEISETEREVLRSPGAIKKLTVAVLVNGRNEISEDGSEQIIPLPEEELVALQDLVASAVGFDANRGDVITIKSIPFEPISEIGTPATVTGWGNLPVNLTSLVQAGVLGFVALILGLFVVRPILRTAPDNAELQGPFRTTPTLAESSDEVSAPIAQAHNIEIDDGSGDFVPINGSEDDQTTQVATLHDTEAHSDPVERLRSMIGERKEETVEILRGWLDETEKPA